MVDALGWLLSRRRGERSRDGAAARALLDRLGVSDPPAVVHVVGTNGKGSVTYALAAMATAAGHTSGRFTSPHVESPVERIAIDGRSIELAEIAAFATRVAPLLERGDLPDVGFFDLMLALALERFAAAGVTLAVLEAGVGARYDATSAVGGAVAGVLTNVALDHVETLGPTIADIAADKAFVARRGVPLVTGARGGALAVVAAVARGRGAPLAVLADGDARFVLPPAVLARSASWPATHVENMRLACAVGRVLAWPEPAIAAGALAAPPPARFERFMVGETLVVLDGAHDPAAAAALAAALPRPFVLVFGALARKQGGATLEPLQRLAAATVVTSADAVERAGPWPADARVDEPGAALAWALDRAGARGTVVVAGSLYLAGRVRPLLRSWATGAATERVATG
jgi:dihydrofolate synthase / folylpolyglutamate synthase